MRIVSVGGGPAGLYFAILMKQADAAHEITVLERNRADDTFGFGVVFSDETLGTFAQRRSREPRRRSARASSTGTTSRSTTAARSSPRRGTASPACRAGRCSTILHASARARSASSCASRREIGDADVARFARRTTSSSAPTASTRWCGALLAPSFEPHVEPRPNRFVWLGTTFPFDAFTFYFKPSEAGLFRVHAYRYAPEQSTFIVECTEETFARTGLGETDEDATVAYCERALRRRARRPPLLTNRSLWRQFPTVRCERWHQGNVVLVGDAAHTAHFSIGSGTKLAMEDAIALATALEARTPTIPAALAAYEAARRPASRRCSAPRRQPRVVRGDRALLRQLHPLQFTFSLLTRCCASPTTT